MGRGLRHSQVVTSGESVYIRGAPGNCSFWRSSREKGGFLSSLSLSLSWRLLTLFSLSFGPLLAVSGCRSSGADYSPASLVYMSDELMKSPHSFRSHLVSSSILCFLFLSQFVLGFLFLWYVALSFDLILPLLFLSCIFPLFL